MNRIFKYSAVAVGVLSFTYLAFTFAFFSYVASSSKDTWETMQTSPFTCPAGAEVTYRGWSENGTMRYCEPLKKSPWEAWMSGYRWIEGSYRDGKEQGVWRWFDKVGKITKTIHYKDGKELPAEEQ